MKIASYLPKGTLSNADLIAEGFNIDKIYNLILIKNRHIAAEDEFSLDLAEKACHHLFKKFKIDKKTIDYLVYCTQTPDHLMPNSSSVLQDRLSLSKEIGSLDYIHGCSGFVYGLSIAKGLIETGQAKKLLLVLSDTISKYLDKKDIATRSIMGDGACAVLLDAHDMQNMPYFVFNTDGKGAFDLCVRASGLKDRDSKLYQYFSMNGPAVFVFTLDVMPKMIKRILQKYGMLMDDVDHFIFHQPNGYILEQLRQRMKIPEEKFHIYLEDFGNTSGASIPFVLEHCFAEGKILNNQKVLLLSFGIGYTAAATIYTYIKEG